MRFIWAMDFQLVCRPRLPLTCCLDGPPPLSKGNLMTVKAYGAQAADKPLESLDITRRAPGAHDVEIDIAFCGVCHSDLHTVRAEWAGTRFPCVPGHEIVGRVSA